MNKPEPHKDLLPHLFRLEYTKMTAVLCRHFGLQSIETAEDIASETFLKASENWAIKGIPQNPEAWLYKVAKNKAKDYFKRLGVFENQVKNNLKQDEVEPQKDFEINNEIIADSQLAMIFAVCNPNNAKEGQISLALQILCGFSVEEIANAFLSKKETIKKRLLRARANLRNSKLQIKSLKETEITSRLDSVLQTMYLLFNEGYFSKNSDQLIRKELCAEAIRLTLVLTENPLTNTLQVNALLALMCFQSSRLEARTNDKGEAILFEEQDRNLWDQSLIQRGNYYLVNATNGNETSKYHLEAGIAYWHTTPTNQHKWKHILDLYNQLIQIEYSPITALNRIVAFAKVHGNKNAIIEAEKVQLADHSYYHDVLGYLYTSLDIHKAVKHYEKALALTSVKAEKQTLARAIKRLKEK